MRRSRILRKINSTNFYDLLKGIVVSFIYVHLLFPRLSIIRTISKRSNFPNGLLYSFSFFQFPSYFLLHRLYIQIWKRLEIFHKFYIYLPNFKTRHHYSSTFSSSNLHFTSILYHRIKKKKIRITIASLTFHNNNAYFPYFIARYEGRNLFLSPSLPSSLLLFFNSLIHLVLSQIHTHAREFENPGGNAQ